jgi:sodium-dependent dicarboxylate transporter 2/3/5
MMLAFLAPVLKALPADGKGKIGLALSIPVAANIGGMATPIGTPPNGIVLKYLEEMGMGMGFGEWIAFMGPVTIALLLISWVILLWLFPFKQKTIVLDIPDNSQKGWRTTLVYITFFATIVMWLFDKNLGLKTNAVAMFPVAVFCATGIITKRDLEQISWSVLWMVAGGFALGVALNKSGLAQNMIDAIPFASWSPLIVIIGSGLLCYAMANFISHTATAALLVPILAVVGESMSTALGPVGGVATLLVGVAIASSVGMVLPISTPPNALAYATGLIEQKNMVKVGLIMGAVSLLVGYGVLIILGTNGLL